MFLFGNRAVVLLLTVFITFLSASLSFGANLLFRSGFEQNTYLPAVPSVSSNNYWLSITGTDQSTGFSWPFQGWSAGYNGLRMENASGDTLTNHFNDYVSTSSSNAHSGNNSLYMSISNYSSGSCCSQQYLGYGQLNQPLRQFYERYWFKYPTSWQTAVQNHNAYMWDSLIYFKTLSDYRSEPNLWTVPSLNFALKGHLQSDPGGIDATCPRFDPISFQVVTASGTDCGLYSYANIDNNEYTVQTGTWHEVEYYLKRSPNPDGRIFFAIDGHVIGDYTGITMGPYAQEIRDIGFLFMYSPVYPQARWFDDWEVWDAPPCTTLPCGTVTGTGGGTAFLPPPAPTSYAAAVGTVGVPFRYQITATNSPTSYGIDALPAGLSLNSSTGLISGTPTSAGSTGPVHVQIYNSSGKAVQMLQFRIDSGTQPPSIPYFWVSTPTITAGQPATLKWITLGAGPVALSINNGVGTVSGPNGSLNVYPNVTTTYTLTVSNSAGSVSKSVTVNVSGTSSPAPSPTPTPAPSPSASPSPSPTPVPVTSSSSAVYNGGNGIVADGTTFSTGLDAAGNAYSANLLGTSLTMNGATFTFGPANNYDFIYSNGQTIALPQGQYASLRWLATGVNGAQSTQSVTVTYTDGTSTIFTQSFSDWAVPQYYPGEAIAKAMSYRNASNGTKSFLNVNLYAYAFPLDSSKTVRSMTLPSNNWVAVLAYTLVAPGTTVAASPTPTPAPSPSPVVSKATYTMSVSKSPYRSGGVALQNTTVSGGVYLFTSLVSSPSSYCLSGISQVCYWLDNPAMSGAAARCEKHNPYDFAGSNGGCTSAAGVWSTLSVPNGAHSITQRVTKTDGTTEVNTITFNVSN